MVDLKEKIQVVTGSIEPEEGKVYIIKDVEEVTTAVRGYKGLRVVLEPERRAKDDRNTYATMLWYRERVGTASKLGAFISAFREFFGDDASAYKTENWINHKIRVITWTQRRRELKVVE